MRGALIVEVATSQVGSKGSLATRERGRKRRVATLTPRRRSSRLRLFGATARRGRSVTRGGRGGRIRFFRPNGRGGCLARVSEGGGQIGGRGRKKVRGLERIRENRIGGEETKRDGRTTGRSLFGERNDRSKGRVCRGPRGHARGFGSGRRGRVSISGRRAPYADGQVRKNKTNEGRARHRLTRGGRGLTICGRRRDRYRRRARGCRRRGRRRSNGGNPGARVF